jgi:hypothetical protein
MAKKLLFIQLQTPSIELPIVAIDASGKKATIQVGFKRYTIEESDLKLQAMSELFKSNSTTEIEKELIKLEQNTEFSEEEKISKIVDLRNRIDEILNKKNKAIDEFIKNEILYIREAHLSAIDEETGKESPFIVKDTRTEKANDFWENSEECLEVLLSHYFNSSPWKNKIIEGFNKSLLNIEISQETARKN